MADPVPVDIESFITEKVLEYDETFEIREGSAFRDFFIKPLTFILQPLRDEIEIVRALQSLLNFDAMSDDELDLLINNYFISRRSGNATSGSVRMYFSSPRTLTVYQGTAFIAVNGLRFLADVDTSVLSTAMAVNTEGALYYMDVDVTSESSGEDYNIERGSITAVETNYTGLIRVTNLQAFTGSVATETNTELVNRAQRAITVRNLVNDRSVITTLLELYSFIRSIQPIGTGDPEMVRDLLTILLPGPPQHTETIHRGGRADIYVEADGFETASTTVQAVPDSLRLNTNSDRGRVDELDFGFRNISIQPGFFNGVPYAGEEIMQLLPNTQYTLYLELNSVANEWTLGYDTSLSPAAFPSVPGDAIALAEVATSGGAVTTLNDIREDIFSFDHPIVAISSIEVLDSTTLQPTGVELRNGEGFLISPSIAAEPGSTPAMQRSRGTGDLHLIFKKSDGVYYQRHDSQGTIVITEQQISTDTTATNLRLSVNLQDYINVFFLTQTGNIRHLQIDNTGANTVAESTISGAGITSEFMTDADRFGETGILSVNDNAGQPDIYFIRVDEAGAVSTAQTLTYTSTEDNSSPDLTHTYVYYPTYFEYSQNNGEAPGGTTELVDNSGVDFTSLGLVPGTTKFLIISGTDLATSDLGVRNLVSVDSATKVTLSGTNFPATSTSDIRYEMLGYGDIAAVWMEDRSGTPVVLSCNIGRTTGVIGGPTTGNPIVISDPRGAYPKARPRIVFNLCPVGCPGYTQVWVSNDSQLEAMSVSDYATWPVSLTGDTQTSALTRSFYDASNPFTINDEGSYIAVISGSGLSEVDFRLYKILEYVDPGHVLLDQTITESTAADIEYAVAQVYNERRVISADIFSGTITDLDLILDTSANIHMGVIETVGNSGQVYLGKFNGAHAPLLHSVFDLVSTSVNNRSSLSIQVDEIRQPYLVWDDYTAGASTVQMSVSQAQEYAYLINDIGTSYSMEEDSDFYLDPIFSGAALRFNYLTSSRIATVDAFVRNTVNRILNGFYLTKHTLPAFVDVELVYSGGDAPSADDATTLLIDYINGIGSTVVAPNISAIVTRSTLGDILETSDLIDVLYDNGADSVRVGSELVVTVHQPNGSALVYRDIDKVQIPRTVRFTARDVTATVES